MHEENFGQGFSEAGICHRLKFRLPDSANLLRNQDESLLQPVKNTDT